MRRFKRRLGAATLTVTLVALLVSGTPAVATPGAGPETPEPVDPTSVLRNGDPTSVPPELIKKVGKDGRLTLRLITGDRVEVGLNVDGQPVVQGTTPAARAGGHSVVFHTVKHDGKAYVVPHDAMSLLARGVLDWEVFNLAQVAELAASGRVDEVPVIVTYSGDVVAEQAPAASGASLGRAFESVNARSMTIAGNGKWWQQVQAAVAEQGPDGSALGGPLAGVKKVWLDGLAHISLDESVPQIGAPTAWDLGFDGSGVKVAVLDTGIDPNHPDVAGQVIAQRDFTLNANGPVDGNGHGTHVAATIAGNGDASNGLRPGVAPGADLMIGKVCTDGGGCLESSILAGMEWAADSGARVVNMSLGGEPTDGTDVLSMAVNQLSQAYGTLFVIAAGNSGPDPYTVSAPGAADEALTVAAVTKSGEMAEFSSRGPRVGDDAPKPDIAAPGVDIVAARAAGTALGRVVDDYYVALSGTSMATPHVAGAAALVAQKYSDLSGHDLKQLLMRKARDLGHEPTAQGAGMVDVAGAMEPSVFGDAHLNFGALEYPHDQPVSRTLTYTNLTHEPVTLTLAGSLSFYDGTSPPDGMFTLGAEEVTVPARGTAETTLVIDGTMLGEAGFGQYHGVVTATDQNAGRRVSTRVTAFLEPQRYEFTAAVTPREGASGSWEGSLYLIPVGDRLHLRERLQEVAPGEPARVYAGTYALVGAAGWIGRDGYDHLALPYLPEVEVTDSGPTRVRIDLNRAKPLRVDTPEPTEVYDERLDITRVTEKGKFTWVTSVDTILPAHHDSRKMWVLPTDRVSAGSFNVTSSHTLIPPPVTMKVLDDGAPVTLDPRYYSPDVSAFQARQWWPNGPGDEDDRSREVWVPIPRFDGTSVAPVVYAGTGTQPELARVNVKDALALLTPTDICEPPTWPPGLPDYCGFNELRERVAAAAEAGAIGVLVANRSGVRVELQAPGGRGAYLCPDGWDSCPEIEPYAAVPIMTIPAVDANLLIGRLERERPVRMMISGQSQVSRAYALSFTGDRITGDWPAKVEEADLNRVEHRIHSTRPAEVYQSLWARYTPQSPAWAYGSPPSVQLPTVATQRSVTVLTLRDPDAVDRFKVGTIEFDEPFVRHEYYPPSGHLFTFYPTEYRFLAATGDGTVSWNDGPRVPGAVTRVTSGSGFTPIFEEPCSGCREGNWFSPQMYLTSASGNTTEALVGVNEGRIQGLFNGNSCDPPVCQIRLRDAAGNEYEQQDLPLSW